MLCMTIYSKAAYCASMEQLDAGCPKLGEPAEQSLMLQPGVQQDDAVLGHLWAEGDVLKQAASRPAAY